MIEKIKKHWKEILIVLLALFGLNKCTQSCNRDNKLTKANTELYSKDSIIKVYDDSIKNLNRTLNDLSNDYNSSVQLVKEEKNRQWKLDSIERVNKYKFNKNRK